MDRPNELARTVLAFMLKPMMGGKAFILRLLPVHTLNADFLKNQVLKAIHICESVGGRVMALMSNNHSTNRHMHSALWKEYPIPNCDSLFKVMHLEDSMRCLYLLIDPIHLFKSIRNNWLTETTQTLKYYPTEDTSKPCVAKW